MYKFIDIGDKIIFQFLVFMFVPLPLQADAETVFLKCEYKENVKTVNAQGKLIQDDWREYMSEIELRTDQYFMTLFFEGKQYSSQGSVTATSRKYFLKSTTAQYNGAASEIFSQTFIDRSSGEFYQNYELLMTDSGAINSNLSRGTCELQDAPITKF